MPIARIGENDLYYEERGAGPGLPAVLLMGLGVDLDGWEFVREDLARDRRLLLIDNRGVGRSSKPRGPYTTAGLAADTVAVMNAVGMGRAHVVGISLGGAIAQELALGNRDRVRSLALLATFADLDREMAAVAGAGLQAAGSPGADMARTLQEMADGGQEMDPRAVYAFLQQYLFSPAFIEREKTMLRDMFRRALERGISTRGFAGQMAAAWSHRTLDRLPRLDLPVLVVTGTRDRLVPPSQSRAIAQAIPGARLVELEGARHGLVIEQAEETGRLLGDWLREQDPV